MWGSRRGSCAAVTRGRAGGGGVGGETHVRGAAAGWREMVQDVLKGLQGKGGN